MVLLYNIGIGWYVCQISMISVHTSMLHRSVKRATPSCFDEKLHSVETHIAWLRHAQSPQWFIQPDSGGQNRNGHRSMPTLRRHG